jgi:hypothetical protein
MRIGEAATVAAQGGNEYGHLYHRFLDALENYPDIIHEAATAQAREDSDGFALCDIYTLPDTPEAKVLRGRMIRLGLQGKPPRSRITEAYDDNDGQEGVV